MKTRVRYVGPLALPRVVVAQGRDFETDEEGIVEVPQDVAKNLVKQGWVKVKESNENE